MGQLLAILLYLMLIVSPGTYYESEINDLHDANEPDITAVENDATLNAQVQSTYGPQVEFIDVLDDPTI